MGQVGFPGRYDDAAIGTVINLATRLCAVTQPGQILVTPQVRDGITGPVRTSALGPVDLRGFTHPVEAFEVVDSGR